MNRVVDENTEIHAPHSSAPPHGTPGAEAHSTAVAVASASPSPANTGLPAHLQDLTERARGYVDAASSANTRKSNASDWRHFSA